MTIKDIISSAGKNLHTILLTAKEKDGSIETREAEPYSYRFERGSEFFYCYDIMKKGTRKFEVKNIISVEETNNSFTPIWPIEV
ncbi:MAG: hypothetical protein AB1325_04240 [Nitrospirota bacterium]